MIHRNYLGDYSYEYKLLKCRCVFFVQSIDQLFQYLSTNLQTLRERLFDSMYPYITQQMWMTITDLMEEQVFIGVRSSSLKLIRVRSKSLKFTGLRSYSSKGRGAKV